MNKKVINEVNLFTKKKRMKKYFKDTSMMNDVVFKSVLNKNPEFATFILRIILNKKDLVVKEIMTQETLTSLVGRSIILDAHAIDSKNNHYNIEMQKAKNVNIILRSRYHLSILDSNNLKKGDDFTKLPDTYIIFFCDFDLFKENKPIYVVERHVNNTLLFNDLEHIIFVNCRYSDISSDIGKLIHDIRSMKGEEKCYNIFDENDIGGIDKMGDVSELIMQDGIKIGVEKEKNSIIVSMLKNGLDIDLISKITNKPEKYILSIKEKIKL